MIIGRLASEPWILCFHFPWVQIITVYLHIWHHYMGLGDRTRVFMLAKQVLYSLSYLSSTPCLYFKETHAKPNNNNKTSE